MRLSKGVRFGVIGLRIALGCLFVSYGAWKVRDGYVPLAVNAAPGSAGEFFRFMESTGLWWDIVGWTQIGAGMLLITQRFATVGTLILLPVAVNILAVNLALWPAFGSTIYLTIFSLFGVSALVAYDYHKWKYIFWRKPPP